MPEVTARVEIDPTAYIDPTAILQGNVRIGQWSKIEAGVVIAGSITIGDHTVIHCGTVLRGPIDIGNYVQIFDQCCIEGGRGPGVGTVESGSRDRSIIKDGAWINHGASMHGCQLGEHAAIGLNAALDYNCRLGNGAIVMNGSACRINTEVPDNCVAEGVPAQIVERDITDEDRLRLLGLNPKDRVVALAAGAERFIRQVKGL
ncbi:MAG: gamma carbonic anhydrase family protein [Chloroflexota bacterium]